MNVLSLYIHGVHIITIVLHKKECIQRKRYITWKTTPKTRNKSAHKTVDIVREAAKKSLRGGGDAGPLRKKIFFLKL